MIEKQIVPEMALKVIDYAEHMSPKQDSEDPDLPHGVDDEKQGGDTLNRVGEFRTVSYGQFKNDMLECGYSEDISLERFETLRLPKRATSGSAGYDFYSPINLSIQPRETVKFPTGIRVKIDNGWWLMCLPRSSMGFKYKLTLDNTAGVIDSDYFYADNEGHIFVKMTNYGNSPIHISHGEAFMLGKLKRII